MWAIRRASIPLKKGSVLRSACASVVNSSVDIENKFGICDYALGEFVGCQDLKRGYHSRDEPAVVFSFGRRGLSFQAGAKSGGEEDDLEDGFSELGSTVDENVKRGNEDGEDELASASEMSDDDGVDDNEENEVEVPDTETEGQTDKSDKKEVPSKLANKLTEASGSGRIQEILDKWVEEGNDLDQSEIYSCMLRLRKRRMYWKALQLLEWLELNKRLEFGERDYASKADLIAKVRGLERAEKYIKQVPESFIGEPVYRTLLANCVKSGDVKKSEEVFNRMKELQFPITTFSFNQLLLLYRKIDKKKIGDVLLLMEKENVKPSPFTYKILIDAKGHLNDITGMDQIVETMKAEGMKPDLSTQAVLAKHYFAGGLKKKAENLLKEMEEKIKEKRWISQVLLPLYGELGKADEVERVWKFCETSPRLDECVAAIEAYGKLKNIEKAEAVFDKMSNTWKRLSSKHFSSLLKVYINNKMLGKGKDLVKRMVDSGCQTGPLTWDALVKLYIEAGEVEKADTILQKAAYKNKLKPLYSSYIAIMDHYAKRGDIHNAEKIFYKMRVVGYSTRLREFQSLVQAYINANSPAYGIRDRMKAANLYPNKALAAQLTKVDAFRKTAVSVLLD